MLGGQYDFVHCTLANFYAWSYRGGATLRLRNIDDDNVLYPMYGARFRNCIITGSGDDEIMGTMVESSDTLDLSAFAQYAFSHSLINSTDQDNPHFTDITWESPDSIVSGEKNFLNADHYTSAYDFHLDSLSRARGIGDPAWLLVAPLDLDGEPRDTIHPDAGCYQYRPVFSSDGARPYRIL